MMPRKKGHWAMTDDPPKPRTAKMENRRRHFNNRRKITIASYDKRWNIEGVSSVLVQPPAGLDDIQSAAWAMAHIETEFQMREDIFEIHLENCLTDLIKRLHRVMAVTVDTNPVFGEDLLYYNREPVLFSPTAFAPCLLNGLLTYLPHDANTKIAHHPVVLWEQRYNPRTHNTPTSPLDDVLMQYNSTPRSERQRWFKPLVEVA
jgi:hypothetical protein